MPTRRFVAAGALPALLWTGRGAGAQPYQILEPWQTVELEHQDRKQRLTRLASVQGTAPPLFFEYTIAPGEHGLSAYPVAIPVLRVVFPAKAFFDFDKDDIRPEAAAILATIAASLRLEPPDVTLFVSGHTDGIGDDAYNLDLGYRRARAVAAALAGLGVNKAQMFDISFGKAVPIASNDDDEGRAQNRRVEFLFAARPEPIAAWLIKQPTACASAAAAGVRACPVRQVFRAESVAMATPVTTITGGVARKSIVYGSRVIDIDMRQKVFSIRAPE